MSETGGGDWEPTAGNSFDKGFLDFIGAVGEARSSLGEDTGNRGSLNNEYQNVKRAVEEDHLISFEDGAAAMRKIAEQAREIKARGGIV